MPLNYTICEFINKKIAFGDNFLQFSVVRKVFYTFLYHKKLMRKINVLHIVEDLKVGGIERVIATIATNLDKDKYNLFVWCLARGGYTAEELESKGIKVEILGMGYHCSFPFLLKLCLMMKKARIDILHSHAYTASIIGRLAAILAKIPVIITHVHTNFNRYPKRFIMIERFLSIFTDKVICCSQSVASSVKDYAKIKPDRIEVIYNGVEKSRFSGDSDTGDLRRELGLSATDCVVGCVASLAFHKGQRYILKAAKIIADSGLRKNRIIKFILVGDGPLRKDLERYTLALGIKSEVIFVGLRKDIPEILSIMDMVILPACSSEGLSIALLEAMAKGKPVIGTNIGSIPEIIVNAEVGILIPTKNPQAIADAIISLSNDRERARKIGLAGQRLYLDNFTSELMLQRIEDLYYFLIKEKVLQKRRAFL